MAQPWILVPWLHVALASWALLPSVASTPTFAAQATVPAPGAVFAPAPLDGDGRGRLELTRRLLAHGPWPVAVARDPSNRVSGKPAAMEFGYRMFREPRMSPNGYVSCVACHQTDRAFTDGIARAQGLAPVGRNTPSLANLRLTHWYGWDGGSDSLWMASLRPMLDGREIGSHAARVAQVVRVGDGLACSYRNSFGAAPTAHSDERVMVNVAKAIAAFSEGLITQRTPFDDYRDALARADDRAAQAYPAAAQRGALLFVGLGRCASCHAGPAFSDGAFHRIATAHERSPGGRDAALSSAADPGREAGLAYWRQSPYNRFGRFSDQAPPRPAADGGAVALRGAFRTPSLRNVAVTAPYLHDGSAATLYEAVQHAVPDTRAPLAAAAAGRAMSGPLADHQTRDLVAFLETLTDAQGATRSFPPRTPSPCPGPLTP